LFGSFPSPFPHFSAAEAVLGGAYSVWQAVGGLSGLKLHSMRTLCVKLAAEFCVLSAREKCHIQQNSEARGGTERTGTGHQSTSSFYCFAADASESVITSWLGAKIIWVVNGFYCMS